ncbi:hypothetical protein FACS189472_15410 [Alphaproteobacteria bacterium]|nr:hypothetical protein FACS189472_15410 [Alphaproteobacteria bacterium]
MKKMICGACVAILLSLAPLEALHQAAREGNVELVSQLLREHDNDNAYVNAIDTEGRDDSGLLSHATALHVAVENGHYDVVQLLLKSGAFVELKNRLGDTALHAAARTGNVPIAKLLVKAGADKEAKNNSGSTPLRASLKSQIGMLEFLLKQKCDVNAEDGFGVRPLDWAFAFDVTDAIWNLLLAAGAVHGTSGLARGLVETKKIILRDRR